MEKWKEVSNVVGELGSLLRRRKAPGKKSSQESLKREQEVLVLQEASKAGENVDVNSRASIMRGIKDVFERSEKKKKRRRKDC